MRLYLIVVLVNCLCIGTVYGQVDVKISTTQGVLHIDSGTKGNSSDDVLIDPSGNVGIGTSSPDVRLHIKGASASPVIALQDGTQDLSKVLVSDANGVGTWQHLGLDVVKGVLDAKGFSCTVKQLAPKPATGPPIRLYDEPLYDLMGTITLPPGRWCVFANFLVFTDNMTRTYNESTWIRLSYSDTKGGVFSYDIDGAPWISGNLYVINYSLIQGFSVIVNKTSASKTYYLGVVYADQTSNNPDTEIYNLAEDRIENGIVAVKMADS